MSHQDKILIRGARTHNLKNIDLDLPKDTFIVMTGLSGSGKSSLAFDTIHAEGQRRYIESLSSFARQFLEGQEKPNVDEIRGLSPTLAIDQKSSSQNPRSTVATMSDVYDALRILFARAGIAHCPDCGTPTVTSTLPEIVRAVTTALASNEASLWAEVVHDERGEHTHVLKSALEAGITSVLFDGVVMDTSEALAFRKDKTKLHRISFEIMRFKEGQTRSASFLQEQVKKALDWGDGFCTLRFASGEEKPFSQRHVCPSCGLHLPIVEPRLFSFNAPSGACRACTGLGVLHVFDPNLVLPNPRLTIAEGAIQPLMRLSGNHAPLLRQIEEAGIRHGFSLTIPLASFTEKQKHILLYGDQGKSGSSQGQAGFPGILDLLGAKFRETDSEYVRRELEPYMRERTCPRCEGKRLSPEALGVTIEGLSIADLTRLSVEDALAWFMKKKRVFPKGKKISSEDASAVVFERVSRDVVSRLTHLCDVGLGYVTLDRAAPTLSGGEAQRVRLATQLGSGLSGVVYVLDEPSVGLHPADNDRLIASLKGLRDVGNTVIVVEHDEAVIRAADWVVDVGPGAGEAGGYIVGEGTPAALMRLKSSVTGAFLSGKRRIACQEKPRKGNGKHLTIVGAKAFHLKNVTVKIPLGKFVCVTGVSGSGKSTLILDILERVLSHHFYRAKAEPGAHDRVEGMEGLDKVVAVDQSPIGRTPRSNPATYTGLFTIIRDLFTEVPEAKLKKFGPGDFSFNVKDGGRCETCSGEGMRRIEMQFLTDVYAECPDCQGTRYRPEVLEIRYRGKSIADVLAMTVEEARRFFADHAGLSDMLGVLQEVGLGYMRLGQSATTLSGGEAQRVKLATELARRETGNTLYILDEPTTGLHFADVERLLGVLHRLVEKGNTVLVVEHHMDVVKTADWVIDMGPGGGEAGGHIVFEGTPRELSRFKGSATAKFLKPAFSQR